MNKSCFPIISKRIGPKIPKIIVTIITITFCFECHANDSGVSAEKTFVATNVKLEGCTFGPEVITSALSTALGRLSKINPALTSSIKKDAFRKNLRVICDKGSWPEPIGYSSDDDSIHLRKASDGSVQTMANFWHEFLHFYGLNHTFEKEDPAVFIRDGVYACHMTGFPDFLSKLLNLDSSYVTGAAALCATVGPVLTDLRGFKY